MEINITLTNLNLDDNNIGDKGSVAIEKELKTLK
jgi:hypothetical protein